ncbi:hypothetical protein [Tenacibaculum agarivorans]|uniref:hypothetical protein n=1 Tax=Tenacibaculum agarivorans TaxID=1908389 RepID=UPI00094BA13B|nr:hypothetical protein [Tenacibaculum agarivorans]
MKTLTEDEFLREIFLKKIKRKWHHNSTTVWKKEPWYLKYQKNCDQNPHIFPEPKKLPNGFFEFLEIDLYVVVSKALEIEGKALSYYTSSASSLKRFLGKNKDKHKRFIKKKTGLAIYAGYQNDIYHIKNWEQFIKTYYLYCEFWKVWGESLIHSCLIENTKDFKTLENSQGLQLSSPEVILSNCLTLVDPYIENDVSEYRRERDNRRKRFIMILLILSAVFGGLKIFEIHPMKRENNSVLAKGNELQNSIDDIEFELYKLFDGENRFSVSVIYDIKNIDYQNLSIKVDGDSNLKKIRLSSPRDTIPFMFHKPLGRLSLFIDKKVVKQIDIRRPTTGWIGWADGLDSDKNPKISAYHNQCEIIHEGALTFPDEFIPDELIKYYFLHYRNQQNFKLEARSIEMSIRFKLLKIPSDATCNHISFGIGNEKNVLSNNFELQGCEYYTGLSIMGNKILQKKSLNKKGIFKMEEVLDNFTYSEAFYRKWNVFTVKVKNDTVTYQLNNKNIYQTIARDIAGDITSFGISSKGTWAIDWIKMFDDKGNTYQEDFLDCPEQEIITQL